MSYEEIDPAIALLATQMRHVTRLRQALQKICQNLETRGLVHDLSKLGPEELPGFVRLSAAARNCVFGSDEYRAAIQAERPAVHRHQSGNSHHPEFYAGADGQHFEHMPWLDIIEMVCDWWAANQTYGTTSWEDAFRTNLHRWPWSVGQEWLIKQVARTLSDEGCGKI